MKADSSKMAKPALTVSLICLIAAVCLSGTSRLARGAADRQREEAARQSRRQVLPTAETFEETDGGLCCIGKKDGSVEGYIFTTKAAGRSEDIEVMTGIDFEGTVTGVVILSVDDASRTAAPSQTERSTGTVNGAVTSAVNEAVRQYRSLTSEETAPV